VHVIKKGDTLWDIAQTYGLSHKDIQRWNGRHTERLQVGQKLVLYVPPSKAEAKVEKKPAEAPPRTLTYQVRKGDSLWKISQRFKVSPAELRRWNGLSTNRITPGDRLIVRLEEKTL